MDNPAINKNQVIRIVVLSLLLVVVYLVPYDLLFDKTNTVCLHNHLFGFQCPLCGMTRAVYQLMHLQIALAVNYNFAVVLLPLYMGMDLATMLFRRNWLGQAKKIILVSTIAALVLLYASRLYNHLYGI
ncbi:MAG TPA: DUF2752 domain-containing protein [Prolixibacteraceae bacterium]|nr:DUF2752 domain-containing protein [Prolixibacteraceae bacterium]